MRNHKSLHAVRRRATTIRLAAAVSGVLAAASSHGQPAPENDESLEEVFVLGRGETRQVQSITAAQIEQ